jgi:hypothetical protein
MIWYPTSGPKVCRLERVCGANGIELFADELERSVSVKTRFPDDAACHMSGNVRRSKGLADALLSGGRVPVVSKRLADFLEARKVPKLELLRVSIVNHKKKVESRDYFLVNILATQDCLDLEKSQPKRSGSGRIAGVEQFVLDPDRCDPNVPIFRVEGYSKPVVVTGELANTLDAEAFTNLDFDELEDHRDAG